MDYPVYLGVWTNWSRGGQITGSTLTLSHQNGALLTAFIALFVTFTGSRLWRIGCFVLHQALLSKPDQPQDGLYHQRQAILRNTMDEKTSFMSLLRVLLAWRRRAYRPFYRLMPIIAFALFITIIVTLGSIFSSKISSASGFEVLLQSASCGVPVGGIPGKEPTMQQVTDIYQPWLADKLTSYTNIAQRCRSSLSRAEPCSPFVKSNLPTTIDQDAECPFHEKICRSSKGNVKLDTGYLNSQADLGLNSPIDLQFNMRVVTHCAPLNTRGYRKIVYFSPDRPHVEYYYGAQQAGKPLFTYDVEQQSIEELKWQNYSLSFADYRLE